MITVWYFNSKSKQSEEKVFDYPNDAVEFINNHDKTIFVTGWSCVDTDDADYINARV